MKKKVRQNPSKDGTSGLTTSASATAEPVSKQPDANDIHHNKDTPCGNLAREICGEIFPCVVVGGGGLDGCEATAAADVVDVDILNGLVEAFVV